jgi:hypothetical protein
VDIIVNCGGNTHVMTDEEKATVRVALRLARKRFEDAARQNRGLIGKTLLVSAETLYALAEQFDSYAADADEVLAYFEGAQGSTQVRNN